MFEEKTVASFGGGLNLTAHPLALRDDEWTFSNGFRPRDGTADGMRGYTQVNNGSWLPALNNLLGIVPDLTDGNRGKMLLVALDASGNVRLFRMTRAGVATEITVSGTAPKGSLTNGIPTTAFLNGTQVIACGTPGGTDSSLVSYTGGATFTRIFPATTVLQGCFIAAAAGHLILGNVGTTTALPRRLYISDTLSTTVWDPAISNSADNVDLVGPGTILGVVASGAGVVILTHQRLYAMTATGSIPPFTIQILEERGRARLPGGWIIATPYGVAYEGEDDYYLLGGTGFGRKVHAYVQFQLSLDGDVAKMLWHPTLGCLIRCTADEQFGFDATTQAWWRRTLPTAGSVRAFHDVSFNETSLTLPFEHWIIDNSNVVYREEATTIATGAFVDTKDYAFDSPCTEDYIDRIKVDWEPLTNATSNAVTVSAAVRNDFSPATLGSDSFQTTPTFTTLGTLTGGASELPVRQRGKFARFRFAQTSGRVRIRGFAIRRQRASDRKT